MVKMREGAWYRRRDGEIVGPCAAHDGEDYLPWNVAELWYSDEGDAPSLPSEYHLVEEVPAPKKGPH